MIYDELKQIVNAENIKVIGIKNPNFFSPMGNIMYYEGIQNVNLAPSFISYEYEDREQIKADKIKIENIKEIEFDKKHKGLAIYLKGSRDK